METIATKSRNKKSNLMVPFYPLPALNDLHNEVMFLLDKFYIFSISLFSCWACVTVQSSNI